MFKKFLLLFVLAAVFSMNSSAQTVEELKTQKAEKEAQIAALQGDVDGLQKQIEEFPGWKFGSFGTIGLNFANYSKWLGRGTNANTFSSTLGFSANAFANLDQEKYFWRNSGNLNAVWTKLNSDTETFPNDSIDFVNTADAINISSLYGYKLTDDWALSALGEYRSTIINNFNNPGYLDIGIGATWTPISELVVVFHPLNYNIVMAKDEFNYESSLGCKIVADYAKSLPMGVSWRSNLSAFLSYSDLNNLSNWTWVNGFGFNVWKGIGVGLEFGLRGNRQESYNALLTADPMLDPEVFKIDDSAVTDNNPVQSYWLLGFTYSL